MMDIRNTDDLIDSRDVMARISELHDQMPEDDVEARRWDGWDELRALEKLAEQAEDYAPDWHHGETLIRDSYFKEYAQDMAEDCGLILADAKWPNTCIDWEQAARELQMDYTPLDFDGVTYWIR